MIMMNVELPNDGRLQGLVFKTKAWFLKPSGLGFFVKRNWFFCSFRFLKLVLVGFFVKRKPILDGISYGFDECIPQSSLIFN
jgi:hypothetical protein